MALEPPELKESFLAKSRFYKMNIFSINNIFLYITSFKPDSPPDEIDVLHTKIYAIISTSYLKNHALLVDNKFMIGVPFFHLKVADNFFTLLEILLSLDLLKAKFVSFLKEEKTRKTSNTRKTSSTTGQKPQKSENPQNSKSRLSAKEDAILLEELNFLLRDHLKEGETKKNCKHCIIKFKKSSVIFNLIFGNFPTFFKDYQKTDFFLLEKLMKKQKIEENYGIFIDFFSSQRLKTQVYKALDKEDNMDKNYVISLNWPFLLVTIDTGFFKNNMTIHCSRAKTVKTKKITKILVEEMKSPQSNLFESNLNSPEKKRLIKEEVYRDKEEENGLSWDNITKNIPIIQDVSVFLRNYSIFYATIPFFPQLQFFTIFYATPFFTQLLHFLRNSSFLRFFFKSPLFFSLGFSRIFRDEGDTGTVLESRWEYLNDSRRQPLPILSENPREVLQRENLDKSRPCLRYTEHFNREKQREC